MPATARTGGVLLGTPLEDLWFLGLLYIASGGAPLWVADAVLLGFVYQLLMAFLDVRFDNRPGLWLVAVYPRVPMWAMHIPTYMLLLARVLMYGVPHISSVFHYPGQYDDWQAAAVAWATFLGAWGARGAFLLLTLLALYINRHLPMTVFPKPLGPYRVGHKVAFVGMKDGRRCRVRMLYPVEVTHPQAVHVPTYSYWPATSTVRMLLGLNPAVTNYFGAERYLFHVHMDGAILEGGQGVRVSRQACKEASLSGNGRLPVLLFSHGLVGCPESDTVLNSQMASWGYICIELEHHDGSCPYTITPWDDGRTVTLSMPDDPLRDSNPPTYHGQASGHTEQRLAELSMLLEVLGQWRDEASGVRHGASRVIGDEGCEHVEEVCKKAADFDMVFASGHSAGAGAVMALAALEASGRAVNAEMLKTPVAGWDNRALSKLEGTENGSNAREVWNIAEDLYKHWPSSPLQPRVPLAGTVALDPWVNSLKQEWVRGGMHGARICLIMSDLYGGTMDMTRDEDHYHRRDAVLLRELLVAPSRATAWRQGCGANWHSPHTSHVIATRGLRNGVDQHGKPLMPVPGDEEEAASLVSVDGTGNVLGINPLSIVVRNCNLAHLNFNDVTVMLKTLSDFLDWAGSFAGQEGSLGTAPNMQALLHVGDLVRTMTHTFAKDVNRKSGNTRGVQFNSAELQALEVAGTSAHVAPGTPAASPSWWAVQALQEASTARDDCMFHLWNTDDVPAFWRAMAEWDAKHGDVFEKYKADVAAGRRKPLKSITAPWL